MNILLLSQFFSTTKGGGEYVFSTIAKTLADENKIWVITNPIINEKYDSSENLKITFVPPKLEYKAGLPTGFFENLRYVIATVKKGFSIIKNKKIDLIHSNNFSPALAGSILSWLTGKPHITTVHDIFSLCGSDYWKLWGKQNNVSKINVKLAPIFEKWIIKFRHHAIHSVSEATKDDLIKFGAKKPIYTIPNVIYYNTKKSISQKKQFQFISIGRLVFYKNLKTLIKAIKIVKENYPQISLLILGDGPERENLLKLINDLGLKENVKLLGFVSSDEKNNLLSTSNALLFPSLCEGFGLVILEAFAHNVPVLVSDIRPMSDIAFHEKTGYLIEPHSEKMWAKFIEEIIKNPKIANEMGDAGRRVLDEGYSIDDMKNKVIAMYNQVIESSRK